ncbi:MAG: hypothetical protein COA45_05560 [Zetaproteobacteria bacterium]|nr:MAG: hypothetical protein COA45_05560 [Zetaproteobacteria bacterium]
MNNKEFHSNEVNHIAFLKYNVEAFRDVLVNSGMGESQTVQLTGVLVKTLQGFQKLLSNTGYIEQSVGRQKENEFSAKLMQMKVQLFADMGGEMDVDVQSSIWTSSYDSAGAVENSQGLMDMLNDRAQAENVANFNGDELFMQLDDIIKLQTDYSSGLTWDELPKAVGRFVLDQDGGPD